MSTEAARLKGGTWDWSLDHVKRDRRKKGCSVSNLRECACKLEPCSWGEQNHSVPVLRLSSSRRIIAYLNNGLFRLNLACICAQWGIISDYFLWFHSFFFNVWLFPPFIFRCLFVSAQVRERDSGVKWSRSPIFQHL